MQNNAFWALLFVGGLVGCHKVVKNTKAKTPPHVVIKVRGADGQYAPATAASMQATSDKPLELACVADDDEGMKRISMSFSDGADGCNVNSAIYSGVFQIRDVPDTLDQSASTDGEGKVLGSIPLLATLAGPFSCEVPSVGVGVPYGQEIHVSCRGTNWSSDPTKSTGEADLTVTLH